MGTTPEGYSVSDQLCPEKLISLPLVEPIWDLKEKRTLEMDQVLSLPLRVGPYVQQDVLNLVVQDQVLLQPCWTSHKCLSCSGSRPGDMHRVTTGRSSAIQTDAKSDMIINSV